MTEEYDFNQLGYEARFYMSKKLLNRALESIDILLKHFPEEELGWFLKGEILTRKGDFEGAYKHINKALELDPNSPDTLHILSLLEISQGNYDKAIEALQKSLKIYPFFIDYLELFNKEQLLFLLKKFKEDPIISSENLNLIKKQIELKEIQVNDSKLDYERVNFLSFYKTIKNILERKKIWKLKKLYEKLAWDTLSIDNMRELLEIPELNLLENLFKMLYPLILCKNYILNRELGYVDLIPERFLNGLRKLFKTKITEIIEKKEKESLIPLIAYNFLSVLDQEDLSLLIEDSKVNFLQLLYKSLNNHFEALTYFVGDELIFDLMEELFNLLNLINFEGIEIRTLKKIDLFLKEELPKNQIYYFQKFNLIHIKLQRAIIKKERIIPDFDLKEIIHLADLASKGNDDIANGSIGYDGYGFVFRDLDYVSKYMKLTTYNSVLVEIGQMRQIKDFLDKENDLETFLISGFGINLLITASVKTLVPSLKLGLGDTFFITWMLVKTPKGDIFPANFYYDRYRMAIGYLNLKFADHKEDISKEFTEIYNFNPINLTEEEENELAFSFELALEKVPKSDYKAFFSGHDYYYDVEVDFGEPYWRSIDDFDD